ncbi:MAG: hypothetical protein BroJett029_06580 [Alphaproteobacteria bacterium]|nr:MAG: hypothetical protein BroJett029_06580 [Alphaproteobacteria bacterium]
MTARSGSGAGSPGRGSPAESGQILITGGAGFIGCNLADALLSAGRRVIVLDNLSRPGVTANADWLRERHGDLVTIRVADIRNTSAVAEAVDAASAVVHLAAQVAVTESLESPVEDFTINAAGTLHLLEALRRQRRRMPLVFASTNKVYGTLEGLQLEALAEAHAPADRAIRLRGIGEDRPLQFSTPYGCSKGAADQYVLDYAKCYGLPAVVLRMSCIYGPRQFGTEEQGWVAHFLFRALDGEEITLFGDGRQVRDVLHVADAVRAYLAVLADADDLAGTAFNLGGGVENAVSLIAMLREIEQQTGRPVRRRHEPPRPADQLYFVADTKRLRDATGWAPLIGWREGVADLMGWAAAHRAAAPPPPAERSFSA